MRYHLFAVVATIASIGCDSFGIGSDRAAVPSPKRFPIISDSGTIGFIDVTGAVTAQTDVRKYQIDDYVLVNGLDISEDLGKQWSGLQIENWIHLPLMPRLFPRSLVSSGNHPIRERELDAEINWVIALEFAEGLLPWTSEDRWGFINEQGIFSLSPQFEAAMRFAEGVAPVKIDGRWGYVDRAGKVIVAPTFDAAAPFSEGRAVVYLGNRCGYIDHGGRFAVNPTYGVCLPFSDGVAVVISREDERAGIIDVDGAVLITPQFEELSFFVEELAAAKIGDLWWLVDRTGKIALQQSFDGILPPLEGKLWLVRKGTRWGFIDTDGHFVIAPTLDDALPFSEGVARVQSGDRWGFIKPDGSYLGGIAPSYEAAGDMHNRRAAVQVGGRWGFIDDTGEIVVQPTYEAVGPFLGALAPVVRDGKLGYIDRSGKVIRAS